MSEVHELAPGGMVTPSIRLVRLLGRGGMGSVWIGEHLRLHTQVVVKFMAAEYAQNAEAMARFEREASLAAQAKSPHVVQVFDHGISQFGLPYIAMELLEGEDLAKRIERDRCIDPVLYAGWLAQACRGLSRAHGKGIVHRDIKPENIFLCDNDGEILVKVLDFGIAKSESAPGGFSGTRTGAFLGTAYYMSPEQTMGAKDLDHRSDLWALGVVSYFALTGVRPFDADALGPLVMAITSGPIPPPSARNPALSSAIDVWMARALARAREQRFESAKHMAEAFAQAVGLGALPAARASSASLPGNSSSAGVSQAITAPSGGLGASTMSPSVRGDANSLANDPPTIPHHRTPWLVIALVALGLLGIGAFSLLKLVGSNVAEETEANATSASAVVVSPPPPAPAAAPVPALSPEPTPTPTPAAAPSAPVEPPRSIEKPAVKPATAKAPAVAVATPKPAPEPAKAVAAPVPKAVVATPPKAVAPQPASNPLKMKME